jgi:hypothetical protein
MEIRRFDTYSVGKVAGLLYAVAGVLVGAILLIMSIFAAALVDGPGEFRLGPLGGMAAVVLLPFVYGVLGFIAGALGAWLYNVAAGMVGGVKFDVE